MGLFNNYKGFGPASAEYWEGRKAFLQGKTEDDNPYVQGSSQWHDWNEGYTDEMIRTKK